MRYLLLALWALTVPQKLVAQDFTPGPLAQTAAQIVGARFLDVEGIPRRLGDDNGAGPVALVFVDQDCPVSARYLGELNSFASQARSQGIDFYAVISSPRHTWTSALQTKINFGLNFPVLFDASGDLLQRLNPIAYGEAFVINGQDRMIYRGRIDDRFVSLGKLRKRIRSHDLLDAFSVAHKSNVQAWATASVGCYIEPVSANQLSYVKDIGPVIAANCLECHQGGGVAPFSLSNYSDAQARSRTLALSVRDGYMPPWKARPEHGRFRDERYLTAFQRRLFKDWADAGAPLGLAQQAAPQPRLPDPKWRLGAPDVIAQMVEPFAVPAQGEDVYRYFVIPSPLLRDRVISAIDFLPGDAQVVHHANFFADYSGRARREDAKDSLPGFSVFGTGEFMSYDGTDKNSFGIGGWAPGAEPYQLPNDVGLWLPAGGDLVIEVHYKLNGRQTVDQSQLGLYFAKRAPRHYIDGLLVGSQDLDIKAGDPAYIRHIRMRVPAGFKLVDVMPHMHYIGRRARMHVTYPNGQVRKVIGIDDWDLRWQNIYALREPLHIPRGSVIDVWWEYDNSDLNPANPFYPAQDIKWGWKSEEEMAEVWMGVILDNPRRRTALLNATWEAWGSTDNMTIPEYE